MRFFQIIVLIALLSCLGRNGNAQLVLPGDYPDPSVAKVGNTYWASATTSNWAPAYPLLSSQDLVHWENKGYVFPQLPGWADYYFWAPEISHENGRTYIYYAAHKKGGNLCLAVASSDKPEGPYKDHGPLMCQQAGSIDAFPMRDENGKLFLIWKEDGNSVGKPTPIWMSEMKEDRSELVGEKIELFRNDKPWESNLVEGVSMIRHGEFFYAFYAAAGCCGKDCSYVTGVARSRRLAGPWEKFEKNPLLVNDDQWICPGHGTPIEKDGKFYFLYHAYNRNGGVYAGRQGVLRQFEFTADGWIRFLPADFFNVKVPGTKDEFDEAQIQTIWQWSVFNPAKFQLKNGKLELSGAAADEWTYLGQKTYLPDYKARVQIDRTLSTGVAGIAAIGDEKNIVGATVFGDRVSVWTRRLGKDTVIAEQSLPPGDKIFLEMKVERGHKFSFRCSTNGRSFKYISRKPIDGAFLPPWDRAVRIGVLTKGADEQKAVFENFILYH